MMHLEAAVGGTGWRYFVLSGAFAPPSGGKLPAHFHKETTSKLMSVPLTRLS